MKSNTINCIVFDFDGTLVDSNLIKQEAYYVVSHSLGYTKQVVANVLASVSGDRFSILREIVNQVAQAGQLPESRSIDDWVSVLVAEYTALCEQNISTCPEIPGATVVLSQLKTMGYLLFVSSATPLEPLKRLLSLRKLDTYFAGVYGRPATKVESLQEIMNAYRLSSRELVVVGDGEDDRESALVTGCNFIRVDPSFSPENIHDGYIISDLSMLVPTLERLKFNIYD